MWHKHYFVMLCLLVVCLAGCGPTDARREDPPAPITSAELVALGQHELDTHIRQMPVEARICVAAEQERRRFTLGQSYERYRLRSGSKRALKPGVQLATLIEPANQWEFPVLLDNRVRCQMTAAFFQGRWQVVEAGSATYLQPLIDYQAQHSGLGTPRLIEFAPNSAQFAWFGTQPDEQLLLLTPNGFYFETIDATHTYTVDELIPAIVHAMNERGVR